MYHKRKAAQIVILEQRLKKLANRAKYIQYVLADKIDLRRKKAVEIDALLEKLGFNKLSSEAKDSVGDYKYLIKMPMDSVSEESVEKIMKEKAETETELATLIAMTVERIWLNELDVFEKEYGIYKKKREHIQMNGVKKDSGVRNNQKKIIKRK
jgi:DNA-binding XRE family transcriptional regulator